MIHCDSGLPEALRTEPAIFMRDLDLKSLRLLLAVCEHRNIKQAALQEHIEPSAISKRIAGLEQVLGTTLLLRSRRGVEPTVAGQVLIEHARTILFTMSRIESDMTALSGGMRGHVRLVASASAIAESLLDDVADFMKLEENRNIKIDLEEKLSLDLTRLVREGGAALGVCWDTADFDGLETQAYRIDELALAVPPGHPLSAKRTVRFEQTLPYEHVGLPPTTAVHTMLQRSAARLGKSISYRAVVSNFDSAFRVVAAGLAISVVPRQVGESFADPEAVRLIGLSDAWARRRFALCYRLEPALQPAAARLLRHLSSRASRDNAAREKIAK